MKTLEDGRLDEGDVLKVLERHRFRRWFRNGRLQVRISGGGGGRKAIADCMTARQHEMRAGATSGNTTAFPQSGHGCDRPQIHACRGAPNRGQTMHSRLGCVPEPAGQRRVRRRGPLQTAIR